MAVRRAVLSFAAISTLVVPVLAQTHSLCNPRFEDCPPAPALGTNLTEFYNSTSQYHKDLWTLDTAQQVSFPDDNSGMALTITESFQAPTLISSYWIFWGKVEVMMKASPGTGIISSIVLLSADLDEVDYEILGGNTTHVFTNYYGKGDRNQTNGAEHVLDNPQGGYHNYTFDWTQERLDWWLDGSLIRTVTFDEAKYPNGSSMYPQTPCQLKIGSWAAGGDGNEPGVVEWAGGKTDFTQGPFVMSVQDVKVVDGTLNATEYSYNDRSGTYQGIGIKYGTSEAQETINDDDDDTDEPSVKDKFNSLSDTARIGIIAGAAGLGFILFVLVACCCVRKRRSGRRERADEDEALQASEYRQIHTPGGYSASPSTQSFSQPFSSQPYGGSVPAPPYGTASPYGAQSAYGSQSSFGGQSAYGAQSPYGGPVAGGYHGASLYSDRGPINQYR